MGNQDAPKAPAGWYPIEEGKPGERYWDGNAWTGQTKGIEEKLQNITAVPRSKFLNKTQIVAISGVLLIIAAVLVGISSVKPANTVSGSSASVEQQACEAISSAVNEINQSKIQSVDDIDSSYSSLLEGLASAATTGSTSKNSQISIYGSSLASALSEINFTSSKARGIVAFSMFQAKNNLTKIAAECEALGYKMSTSEFDFEIPITKRVTDADGAGCVKGSIKCVKESPDQIIGNSGGYKDSGTGVKYKFTTGSCSYLSCVLVEIKATSSCPSGVYVSGNQIDTASGTAYGITNDALGPMYSGDTAIAELTITNQNANGVRLTEINCY